MNVAKFVALSEEDKKHVACLQGYIVLKDGGVFVIDFKVHSEWKKTECVKLRRPDIEYALMRKLAMMGGGSSIFFHHAIIKGRWEEGAWIPGRIQAKNTSEEEYFDVPIDDEAIKNSKLIYIRFDDQKEEDLSFWPKYD
ncbi:hypothetical protein ACFQ4O_05505 [Methylopila musalis]|uniref:Uncharacterized protein n=1 Tax=Methylopila musalis TaxID=1134781 RepID=A0ABW3Z5G5_9HYPH